MPFAYLTIDDAPSSDFERKVAVLRDRGVPAVFFCVGEQLDRHATAVVEAIRAGFVVANHSYSHPRFSDLSTEQAIRQVADTDVVIERLYLLAGRPRSVKLFRFPYGDKGRSARAVNRYLTDHGYVGLRIPRPRLTFPFLRWLRFRNADSWWTLDVGDWRAGHAGGAGPVHSAGDVLDRLTRELSSSRWKIGANHVLLVHDHEDTTALFTQLIDCLLAHGIVFRLPR